jgi:hypothetical protein
MWLMRLCCPSCYPQGTHIGTSPLMAPSKMVANLVLITWCGVTAYKAGRLNSITIGNAAGQWLLFIAGIVNLWSSEFQSTHLAVGIATLTFVMGGLALVYMRCFAGNTGQAEAEDVISNANPEGVGTEALCRYDQLEDS